MLYVVRIWSPTPSRMAKQTFARVLVSPRVRPRTVLFLVFAVILIHFYVKGSNSFGGQPGFWHQPPEKQADEQIAVPAAQPTPHVENSLAIWHPPKANKENTQRKGEEELEQEEAASKKEAEALKQEQEALKQEEESLKHEAEALKQTEEQRKQQEDTLKHKEEEHEQKLRDDFAREYEAARK